MKLRLLQSGFETYTGQMGTVFFDNGLSTADVKPIDAVRMAAQFLCEWEDGTTASVAQSILDHAHITTGMLPVEQNADQALAQGVATANGIDVVPAGPAATPVTPAAPAKVHTEAELHAVADDKGIKGLREIAAPLGIKGNSIAELIAEILLKQA